MKSSLDFSCWHLKNNRKFSSVGNTWASCDRFKKIKLSSDFPLGQMSFWMSMALLKAREILHGPTVLVYPHKNLHPISPNIRMMPLKGSWLAAFPYSSKSNRSEDWGKAMKQQFTEGKRKKIDLFKVRICGKNLTISEKGKAWNKDI